jgi:hypothetical protein
VARRKAKKREVAVGIGSFDLFEIGIAIRGFDGGAGDTTTALVQHITLNRAGGGL